MELSNPPCILKLPKDLNTNTLVSLNNDIEKAINHDSPVVLVYGANANSFCQGMELSANIDEFSMDNGPRLFADFLYALRTLSKVVIAVVEGDALGGGVGIAAACDIIISSENARFGLPEGVFGLVPAIVTPLLSERMTQQKIRAWALSTDTLSAKQAQAIGLVDICESTQNMNKTVKRTIRRYIRCSPESVELIKNKSTFTPVSRLREQLDQAVTQTTKTIKSPLVLDRINSWQHGDAPWIK